MRALVIFGVMVWFGPAGLAASPSTESVTIAISASEKLAPVVLRGAKAAILLGARTYQQAQGLDNETLLVCLGGATATSPDCQDELAPATSDWVVALHTVDTTDAAGAPQVILTGHLVNVASGIRVQVDRRFCESCDEGKKLEALAGELVSSLFETLLLDSSQDTFVHVTAEPRSSTVVLNGHVVGSSEQTYRVKPGPVRVEVRRDGYWPARSDIQVRANETARISLSLVQVGAAPSHRDAVIGGSALGAGALLSVTGAVLIAADGPRSQTGARLPEARDTGALGATALVGGLGLTGFGVYWLLFREEASAEGARVAVAPRDHGGVFWFSGSF